MSWPRGSLTESQGVTWGKFAILAIFLVSHLNVKAIFCSNVIVVNCNFRRSTSHWLPPRSWPEASWHWVVVICTFIIFVITWNEKFGWFEMFNRIYNLSHATGADGTEAFKSKLKFQIQHEVFRWCDLCIAHIVRCNCNCNWIRDGPIWYSM